MPSDSDNKPDKPEAPESVKGKTKGVSNQTAIALELPFVLVSTVIVGGLLGYFLDRWLHTKPVFMLVFGAIGFFAGVRDILRRLPGNGNGAKDK